MNNPISHRRNLSRHARRLHDAAHRAASKQRQHKKAPPHGVSHKRRGISKQFASLRLAGAGALSAFLAVLGPGLLAGLSDDDPAGITTYSILGAEHGYKLLWIIPASTLLLIYFHLLAVQVGTVSGKGFVALVRQRWGRRVGWLAILGLLFANFGTICAEYAGISAAASLINIPSWVSTPIAGLLISLLVVLGSFHKIEGVLLVISASLTLYVVDGFLANPDWSQVAHNSIVPQLPDSRDGWVVIAATLGTTLAPWGLAFIQSYTVDKKISTADLPWERVDVVIGSLLTGLVGIAIAISCAATLHGAGIHIAEASDAAIALRPLAGAFSTALFGAGLLGASLLAAAIVPIATAYSIAEGLGEPASLDLDSNHFQLFYAAFVGLTVAAVSIVAIPGLPLISLIYGTQVVNAVVLPLHVVTLQLLAGDDSTMGTLKPSRLFLALGWIGIALIVACVLALIITWGN